MHKHRKGSIPLGIRDEFVAVSDHIAYFWETDAEFAEAVAFLEYGLHGNDSCVVFGHEKANSKVLAILESHGCDTKDLENKGRLVVLSGKPSGHDMLSEIGGAFQKAVDRGAGLVRLIGNIGWGHEGWPTELDILEFEARVTSACKNFPCVVVCMYDVRQLSGRIMVHGAYETHPLTVCGNVLRENPHSVPIDDFLARLDRLKARADEEPAA
jgi:hypothetical protein